jgi:hypothetical protein
VKTPVETTPAEIPAEPAGGETPAAPEGETPAEPETPADPDAAPEGETPETTEKNRFRLRLKQDDKAGKLAISIMRGDPSLTMEEALMNARAELGIKTPTAAPAEPEQTKPGSDLPQTIEAVDSTIERLEAERTKAVKDLNFESVDEIDRNLRRLDRQRNVIERQTEQQQAEQAAAYERNFSASERKAADLYDFASKPDSEQGKRMLEIEGELQANNDPLYFDPEKPLRIAQMVAKEFNIAPKSKVAKPAPVKPAPTAPAPKKNILPTGSTVPPATSPNGEIAKKITAASTPADLRKLMAGFGVREF